MQNTPFTPRRRDPGEWAYDHRVGILVTVIFYLLAAIVFLSVKIALIPRVQQAVTVVEFVPEQSVAPEEEKQERVLSDYDDLSDVRNRASNESMAEGDGGRSVTGSLNSGLRDAKGTDAGEIYNEAEAAMGRVRAGREAYQRGLRESENVQRGGGEQSSTRQQDVRVRGRVTVSFSFTNPVRESVRLTVPAYQCEGGGEVVLTVTLNRNGEVTSASVAGASSSADKCMRETALAAARSSLFNVDASAPDKQTGTIGYIFVPQ